MTKPSLTRNLNDIDLTGITDQQTLKWDAASGKIKPGYTPATSGGNQHLVMTDIGGNLTVNGSIMVSTALFGVMNLNACSIATSSTTGLFGVWNSAGADYNGVNVSANGFQIANAVVYMITLHIYWVVNANGSREVGIWKANNAWSGGVNLGYETRGASPNGYVGHSNTVITRLAVNDCVWATAWQNCGGALAIDTANPNKFMIARIA